MTTTVDSIEAISRSIPLAEVVRKIVDAVTITRYLGQQYPRIDALCIIQRDDDG